MLAFLPSLYKEQFNAFLSISYEDRLKRLGGVRIWNRRLHKTPAGVVYAGRPGTLGNPFAVGIHGERGECCFKFERWMITGVSFDNNIATEKKRLAILAMLPGLEHKDLECWCCELPSPSMRPERCHTETIAWLANK